MPDMASKARDYVKIAVDYAKRAVADTKGKEHGELSRLACKRFLNDLKRTKNKRPPFTFSKEHAIDACSFLDKLPHVEGNWETKYIAWPEYFVFMTVNIFGFRKKDGTRRFTDALLAIGRKNAKSTYAAGVGLYCLLCEGENGPQVISGATTGDQARIVWGIAKRMVERLPALQAHFVVRPMANAIPCFENGGTFKPINAKASTQDGLNPSCTILDEIHAHPTHDLMNVLKSAAGGRNNPLRLYTTTEGYENPGPWAELRKFAKNLLRNVVKAEHFFALYFAVDKKDDDFDPKVWVKANPLMKANPVLKTEIAKEAIEAKAMPGKLAEFQIKRLNRPAAAAESWVNLPKWKRCGGVIDLEMLKAHPCYGGLDLAAVTDFNAWAKYWLVDDIAYLHLRFWIPQYSLTQRTTRGTYNFQGWVNAGYIDVIPGDVTDYKVIGNQIKQDYEDFDIQEIAYDPWNAADLVNGLVDDGLPMVQFRQGPASYHPAMQEAERRYIQRRLLHGNNPVLNWMAANLVPRYDVNLNMAPDKKHSADKIDGMSASFMAIGISLTDESESGFSADYELAMV